MKKSAWLLLLLIVPLLVQAEQRRAPYAGRQEREIKALSADQVKAYLEGQGAELALAAELNHYPGPLHTLELTGPLQLTAAQKAQTEIYVPRCSMRSRNWDGSSWTRKGNSMGYSAQENR